jgi:glycosyltransferase involved in cell wall biosynthesis
VRACVEQPVNIVSEPLVSVVTPFHNTAAYLSECIESVLAQNYANFEYILVDNCSTDGSAAIAERYVAKDPRIRLIRRSTLLPQVQNYNRALNEISNASLYCKIVQADDFIFPDCLRRMVQAFEQSESIGLVSAYDLKGGIVRGSGIPYQTAPFAGQDIVRLYLRQGIFPFGSPTTVIYRSSLIRESHSFYQEGLLHEDSEKCIQILENWDFAFVHQVLSFLRVGNESVTSAVRSFEPDTLDRYILVQRYAERFLPQGEASMLKTQVRRDYYNFLAQKWLRRHEPEFWNYHGTGLKTLDESLDRGLLLKQIGRVLLGMIANPGATVLRAVRHRNLRPDASSKQDAQATGGQSLSMREKASPAVREALPAGRTANGRIANHGPASHGAANK